METTPDSQITNEINNSPMTPTMREISAGGDLRLNYLGSNGGNYPSLIIESIEIKDDNDNIMLEENDLLILKHDENMIKGD